MNQDDSTDWLSTAAPYLDKFEDNLRCPICRELLVRAPSITECGHTFCGECITRHFNSSELCPVCRSAIQRSKLRRNKLIGDLTDLWHSGTRASLLELASQPAVNLANSESNRDVNEIISDSDGEVSAAGAIDDIQIPEGHAQCPICSRVLPIAEIQGRHIMKCLNGQSSAPATPTRTPSSSPAQSSEGAPAAKRQKRATFGQEYPETKLAVPHFHSMSEAKLKAKVKELGLPTKGSKQRIIARYLEWLTIWNSSVGDKHPRTISALRKHMQDWERAQDRISEGAPSVKSIDAQQYADQNSDSFADLIVRARGTSKEHAPQQTDQKEGQTDEQKQEVGKKSPLPPPPRPPQNIPQTNE